MVSMGALIVPRGYYISGKPATMGYISTSQTSIITISDQLVSVNIAYNWFHFKYCPILVTEII